MTQLSVREEHGMTWLALQGRLDSMTSPQVQQEIDQLIIGGKRFLVADLSAVGFVSSAGLRVFMTAQKQLKKAGGEIILFGVPDAIAQVLRLSGFDALFRQCASPAEAAAFLATHHGASTAREHVAAGIHLRYAQESSRPGNYFSIGSQEKLAQSRYELQDSNPVKQSDIQFGAGLAAAGDEYEEYKQLFGEAVVINHHFFFYPAVKRPAVDFILCTEQNPDMKYRFLHGFGFSGAFALTAAFEGTEGHVSLDSLVAALFTLTRAQALGLVLLAESKGLLGMNLKQVPVIENRPKNGRDIFDAANFPDWMNFPIEPTDTHGLIAAAGFAVRGRENLLSKYDKQLSKQSPHHVHGCVFGHEPLSKNPDAFSAELKRVLTEHTPLKVQHILGQSKFGSGLVGVVEL